MVLFFMELLRLKELRLLKDRLRQVPVAPILGPRQCGKTTLARQFVRQMPRVPVHWFDLEDLLDLADDLRTHFERSGLR